MVLNYIWIGFFLLGFLVALYRVMRYYLQDFFEQGIGLVYSVSLDDKDVFKALVDSTFSMAEQSVTIAIYLIGIMTLWLGLMKIGEEGGAINAMSYVTKPFFKRLFPKVPDDHPAMGSMLMNIAANMLGLDNAATPLGIKAMKELQQLNPTKDTASNAQILFIVLNTSGLTIIPISIMAYRASFNAANPADIFLPILLTTFCSTIAGLIAVSLYQRINLFNRVVMAYILGVTAIIGIIIFFMVNLPKDNISSIMSFVGNFILISFIIFFITLGIRKRINIYNTFIEGAKEGFSISVKIIPYLVAILVAIGVFRASGAMDLLLDGIAGLIGLLGINTDFVEALPTAFMKPLSGSGARGLMLESFNEYGVDSFVGKLTSTFQGSTETTFYTIAVYFGAVGIRNTRYAVTCGLIADFTAIIAGIFIGYLFFH